METKFDAGTNWSTLQQEDPNLPQESLYTSIIRPTLKHENEYLIDQLIRVTCKHWPDDMVEGNSDLIFMRVHFTWNFETQKVQWSLRKIAYKMNLKNKPAVNAKVTVCNWLHNAFHSNHHKQTWLLYPITPPIYDLWRKSADAIYLLCGDYYVIISLWLRDCHCGIWRGSFCLFNIFLSGLVATTTVYIYTPLINLLESVSNTRTEAVLFYSPIFNIFYWSLWMKD